VMRDVHKLIIFVKSQELIEKIYLLIGNNTVLQKDFSLCDQIKRASISVSCNISEGHFRSRKQSKNYLEIASGSANEVITLLEIIERVYKLKTTKLQEEYLYLVKQINAFSSKF